MTRFCALTSALVLAALPALAGEVGPRVLPFLPVVPSGTARADPAPEACGDALCERLAEQLARGCGRAGDVPYADTVFLRRGLDPGLEPALARAIALAVASNDPAMAGDLLAPFLGAGPPAARYAAGLYLALVHVQSGAGTGGAGAGFAAMEAAAAEGLDFPASDLDFLAALRALDAGDARAARARLEAAIAAEPRFFNALALAIRLDMEHARGVERQGPSLCEAAYGALLDHASLMLSLDPCPRQAAHLDLYLARGLAVPEASGPYLAAKVMVALVARRGDAAREARARFAALGAAQCGARVGALLDGLIETAEGR